MGNCNEGSIARKGLHSKGAKEDKLGLGMDILHFDKMVVEDDNLICMLIVKATFMSIWFSDFATSPGKGSEAYLLSVL